MCVTQSPWSGNDQTVVVSGVKWCGQNLRISADNFFYASTFKA